MNIEEEKAVLRKYQKKGGDKTKQIPGHLQKVAKIGGETVKQKYGADYYRELNKKSQEAKKRKKLSQQVKSHIDYADKLKKTKPSRLERLGNLLLGKSNE